MGVLTPNGVFGDALAALKNILSASSAWQTWCGVATAEDAAGHVFFDAAGIDEITYPFALISDIDWRQGVVPSQSSGILELSFFDETPEAYRSSESDSVVYMRNKCGVVWTDIVESLRTGSLDYQGMARPDSGFGRAPEEERGSADFVFGLMLLTVGRG